ncbi:MAG: M20/M25/M40 family metallo-hydrolase [Bacteroidales bacterium]|nr:M20/M25/M40 family metallo-hydrolase [Bacteroidales bacterium]
MAAIDRKLFLDILSFDSTSGAEKPLADYLEKALAGPVSGGAAGSAAGSGPEPAVCPRVQSWDVPEGGRNLLFSWGEPRVVFCTHMDTVPPYIPPTVAGEMVFGRGACDAKGQIVALYAACRQLAAEGLDGFGLLLLSGEETGSWGAKAFAKTDFRAPYLIIGEPTEGKMVSACKGTKAFELVFHGEAFHSGYPQFGHSAIDSFVDFVNSLRAVDFGTDPELGPTTWNIGRLHSDNAQNVLSPELRCRLYFRTTFLSDGRVAGEVKRLAAEGGADVKEIGGDTPSRWFTIPGFEAAPASFGSDAPHLTNFEHRAICGAGSIRFAHRPDEQVSLAELAAAAERYVAMFKALQK